MKYKGIIFDFNGVLLWDTELHNRAWRQYSAMLRGAPLTDEEMQEHVHGRPNGDIFAYTLGQRLSAEEERRHTQEKEGMYRESCLALGEEFALSPGATLLLDFLREHSIPRTIATASEITNLRFFFEKLGLDRWFVFEKCVHDDQTFPGKPAPDMYLRAATQIGLHPAELIVVEDSRSGLASACAAGIGRVIALGPIETHDRLKSLPGVHDAICTLDEVLTKRLFD